MSATGIEIPSGSRVFLDTSPFIYFIEEVKPYYVPLKVIFEKNASGDFQIITSPLTLTEVLTLPLRQGATKIVAEYEDIILNSPFIYLEPFDSKVAKKAAEIRAFYKIQTADAIQLSSAMISEADLFITNDKRLSIVKEIKVILLDTIVQN